MPTRIGIFGAGLLGRERLKAVRTLRKRGRDVVVTGVYDPFLPDIAKFRTGFDVPIYKEPAALFADKPDWIIVATPHDTAPAIAIDAMERGHKVLLEKPVGRGLAEAEFIVAREKFPNQLFVGFNYRFFDGITAALRDLRDGKLGKLISVNMLLGHGHQPGAEKSWKLDPVKAGGGCLIDPGIHLLDLCHVIAGPDVKAIGGTAWNGYWNTGIEEECHLLLGAPGGVTINLQV